MILHLKAVINLSNWIEEKNEYGGTRRYRLVDGVKEYETLINTTNGLIPESRLKQQNELAREQLEQRLNQKAEPAKICPFTLGMKVRRCLDNCAFNVNGCILSSQTARPEVIHTQGKTCPLGTGSTLCSERCALYFDGSCTYSK